MPTIPNTVITQNTTGSWRITPEPNYALHTNVRDFTDVDEEGNETFVRGYTTSNITVAPNYDFENTTEIDGYTAYGTKEIFARPISDINGTTDRIFGGGNNNDHEVM